MLTFFNRGKAEKPLSSEAQSCLQLVRGYWEALRHAGRLPSRGDIDPRGLSGVFGGRALEKDVPAKYLNSPETPLFHKGSNLYNGFAARTAVHDGAQLIVVEGYVDVIALVAAGFEGAVAPLVADVARQDDDHDHLHELGRLRLEAADPDAVQLVDEEDAEAVGDDEPDGE